MKAYRIIDKDERNARAELVLHTFEEVKQAFEPDKAELPEEWEKWEDVQDIEDLQKYLEAFYEGDAVPVSFEEVEVKSLEELKRLNAYLNSDELENALWDMHAEQN